MRHKDPIFRIEFQTGGINPATGAPEQALSIAKYRNP